MDIVFSRVSVSKRERILVLGDLISSFVEQDTLVRY